MMNMPNEYIDMPMTGAIQWIEVRDVQPNGTNSVSSVVA